MHQPDQPVGVSLLLGGEGRAGLDQALDIAGPRGVVVHAQAVGRQAEVRIAPTPHAGGGKETVLQREIGEAASARLGHGRALDPPAGQALDPLVRRHARRKELELIAAAQELLEPRAPRGHADRAHSEAQGAHIVVG